MHYSRRKFCFKSLSILSLSQFITFNTFAKNSYFLSGEIINLYLMKNSPIKKNFVFLEIKSINPFLNFIEKDQKIYFYSDVELLVNSQAPIKGKITLNSSFRYDSSSRKIYLKDPSINDLSLDILKSEEKLILQQLNPIIAQLFNNQLIYELSNADIALLRSPPSAIQIVDGGILFKFD